MFVIKIITQNPFFKCPLCLRFLTFRNGQIRKSFLNETHTCCEIFREESKPLTNSGSMQ